jgi:hypothetical protein
VPRIPHMDRQGPVPRERSLRFMGRDSVHLISRKGVQPKRQEEEASGCLLTALRGLSTSSTCLSALCWSPYSEEWPTLPSGPA